MYVGIHAYMYVIYPMHVYNFYDVCMYVVYIYAYNDVVYAYICKWTNYYMCNIIYLIHVCNLRM